MLIFMVAGIAVSLLSFSGLKHTANKYASKPEKKTVLSKVLQHFEQLIIGELVGFLSVEG